MNKKGLLIFMFIIFCHRVVIGQTSSYESLRIKELYDYVFQKLDYGNGNKGLENYVRYTNPYSNYGYGEQWGYLLESYLVMYKTTKDKGYLVRFINEMLRIMAWRNENYLFNTDGKTYYAYQDGLLLWAMAHFCYLVLYEEPALQQLVIPVSVLHIPSSTQTANVLPQQYQYTYGFIVNWLMQRIQETFNKIISDLWKDNNDCFLKPANKDGSFGDVMEINMQGPFGGALLYLGKIASNVSSYSHLMDYLDKGAAIARAYKRVIGFVTCCNDLYVNHVLILNTINNSYWWYHAGWNLDKCVFDIDNVDCFGENRFSEDKYTEFYEDISHAVNTLITPMVAYEINLFTGGGYPFSNIEMIRFRNMFTKNVVHGNYPNYQFYNAVIGYDSPVDGNNTPGIHKYVVPAYMPLYKFDNMVNTTPNVYDVVLSFFSNEIYPPNKNINVSGGIHGYGLAHVVNAQWDKECVNLSLYNRRMVYDQDFMVKNTLVVEPQTQDGYYSPGDKSFAEPMINTPEFIIEPNVEVNMVAGERIQLKSGFRAKAGSKFSAKIMPNLCTDGFRISNHIMRDSTNADEILNKYYSQSDTSAPVKLKYPGQYNDLADKEILNNNEVIIQGEKINEIIMSPNPSSNFVTIKCKGDNDEQKKLLLMDISGKVVMEQYFYDGAYIDTKNMAEGMYFVEISMRNYTYRDKILIIH